MSLPFYRMYSTIVDGQWPYMVHLAQAVRDSVPKAHVRAKDNVQLLPSASKFDRMPCKGLHFVCTAKFRVNPKRDNDSLQDWMNCAHVRLFEGADALLTTGRRHHLGSWNRYCTVLPVIILRSRVPDFIHFISYPLVSLPGVTTKVSPRFFLCSYFRHYPTVLYLTVTSVPLYLSCCVSCTCLSVAYNQPCMKLQRRCLVLFLLLIKPYDETTIFPARHPPTAI